MRPSSPLSSSAAVPAAAASIGPVAIAGSATLVSDYRFRGISLSDRDPAVEGTLYAGYRSLFVSAFAASIADRRGANAEIDLSGGWSGAAGPLTLTAGVTGYIFPNGRGTDYAEVFASAARTIGPAELTLGANYAPDQANLDGGTFYVFAAARAGIPATPFTLKASIGHEQGALVRALGAGSGKTDYSVGVEYRRRPFSLGLAYVGTSVARDLPGRRLARGGIVASLGVAF